MEEQLKALEVENNQLKQQLQKVVAERDTWKAEVMQGIYTAARQQVMQEIMDKTNKMKGVDALKETK